MTATASKTSEMMPSASLLRWEGSRTAAGMAPAECQQSIFHFLDLDRRLDPFQFSTDRLLRTKISIRTANPENFRELDVNNAEDRPVSWTSPIGRELLPTPYREPRRLDRESSSLFLRERIERGKTFSVPPQSLVRSVAQGLPAIADGSDPDPSRGSRDSSSSDPEVR